MKKFNGYCLVILFAAIVLAGCQFIWWKQWFNQLEKTITNGINQSELCKPKAASPIPGGE